MVNKNKNKQSEYFNNLWKVKMYLEIREFEEEGKVTRTSSKDIDRTLAHMRYGFYAGIKFAEKQQEEK